VNRRPLLPVAAAIGFVDRINQGDLEGLVALMADDHVLKVLDEPAVVGREGNRVAWRGYMASFPRYTICPERLAADGDRVAILGATIGSHLGLPDEEERKLRVIWTATLEDGQLRSWSVVADSPEARATLGLGPTEPHEPVRGETLRLGQAQGSRRFVLAGRGLNGGDIVQLCCSGGWITGRFEWDGQPDAAPRFFFSIEREGGRVEQQSLAIPEGALLRRV
jgi:ketosteroid isomerase-like protein